MLDQSFSEGARRAVADASRLAVRNNAAALEPLHLLWALLLEESHACELLARSGVTRQRLLGAAPLEVPLPQAESVSGGAAAGPPSLPESDGIRGLLAHARHLAALRGGHSSVETRDLLIGLASIESSASRALAALGVSPESLKALAPGESGETEPLEADVQIRWRASPEIDRSGALRILDAAANRAREGLRVVEDYVRFILDDPFLTTRLKRCRHSLRQALSGVPANDLLRFRDTQADVGTRISTLAEIVRRTPVEVVQAAFKRVQEAVRSLEEFGKLWSPLMGEQLEKLRYELYTLEKAVLSTDASRARLNGCQLYLLVSESFCDHGSGPAIRGALAGGATIVQVREKDCSERKLLEQGRRVRKWTHETGALYILNDRADLAVLTDADGVHVGQDDLSVKEARSIVGGRRLVGVSTHTIEQARQAVLDGADYLGVGPVFPSNTKSFPSLAGLDFVRQVAAEISLPWFAIGGINAENVDSAIAAGARRIAVGQAIASAEDSQGAAEALVSRLKSAAEEPAQD